jgi:predicted dehydrogenase
LSSLHEVIGKTNRFHPAIQRVKSILANGELGAITNIFVSLALPKGIVKGDDIRYDYSLGGGAMMDLGCRLPQCSIPRRCSHGGLVVTIPRDI